MTKKPIIRFKNYNEDWEQRKLGEVLKYEQPTRYIVSSTAYDNEFDTPVLTAGQSFILGYTNEINGVKNASKNNPVIIFDDFTTSSHYVDFPFKVKSSAMKLLELKQNTDDFYFVYNILKNINYIPQTHERHWISIFSHFKVFLPASSEQQKIGSFLKQIDNTITLHQRKIEALEKTKKSFLQKMFPKKDETKPEIRFAGFTDDWEQRKLGEISKHRGGTAIEKYFSDNGQYKVISIGSYGLNSNYIDQGIRAVSNEITDSRVVNSGELTMVLNDKTANGSIIGRSLLIEENNKYVINQRTEIISPSNKFDSLFAYVSLNNSFREQVKRIAQGGTQIYVNYSAVKNLYIKIPCIAEQQKIGTFFKQLDDTIALHQRQLEALEKMKKSFLQKMFI